MSQVSQEFRSSRTKEIVRILSVRDNDGKQVIFWSDIKRQFRGASSIRKEGTAIVFLKNAANETLHPERIEPQPGAVLDVVVGSHTIEESLDLVENKIICDASTYYDLGVSYDKGGGGPTDPALALKNYVHAAELDHAEARTKIGILYRDGYGVEQSYPKAYEWFYKNAVKGAPGSQTELGDMFYYGRGVDKNHYKAKDWYQKAADKGHARGQKGNARPNRFVSDKLYLWSM
ncbi:hypothetical protein BGZ96_005349 [Linnemannia gamsii]|uniref:HCP-like protein n=1 Tax=Linnemannia gamsii TaxID=64522 RepID=A0ABQ7KFE1_9FUNG|nr:hypothetical protein BGZ96_005349 [Linnemannia gamsii]